MTYTFQRAWLFFVSRSVTGHPIKDATTEGLKDLEVDMVWLGEEPGSDYHVKMGLT